jgi:phosphohistidine phosphatase
VRIYLMRHATAADPGGSPDALRPLTEQGRREARDAGKALRERREEIVVVLSSPRLRARETADLVVEGYARAVPIEVRESLSCGATGAAYRAEIEAHSGKPVLLLAHNPELSAFASALVGQSISFRPATICAIDLAPEGARLLWLRHSDP